MRDMSRRTKDNERIIFGNERNNNVVKQHPYDSERNF